MLFGWMFFCHGVRPGRSAHPVNMVGPDRRESYTALCNVTVGCVLIGAVAGARALAVPLVIALFAVMCWAAATLAVGLKEVQA